MDIKFIDKPTKLIVGEIYKIKDLETYKYFSDYKIEDKCLVVKYAKNLLDMGYWSVREINEDKISEHTYTVFNLRTSKLHKINEGRLQKI